MIADNRWLRSSPITNLCGPTRTAASREQMPANWGTFPLKK